MKQKNYLLILKGCAAQTKLDISDVASGQFDFKT